MVAFLKQRFKAAPLTLPGAALITRDLRAARVYEVVGAKYEHLEK